MLDAMLEGNNLSEDPSVGDVKVQGLTRNAALLTEAELKNLVSHLLLNIRNTIK